MRVHSTLTSNVALRRSNARRWLLSLAAVTLLLIAGSASPALAAHGGSHGGGGGGSHHSGGGGGSHGGSGGGYHGGGGHTGGGTSGYHGGGTYHGGSGYHGGGVYSHGSSGFHGGFRGGFRGFYGYHYPAFWGSFFFGYPYPYWYYGPWGYYYDGYYRDGYYRDRNNEQGALDLDLSPADTQVYVNGQYVGKVNDFDGWPQYLWLDPGTYDIVFYREGYKTLARQVTIYRGLVVDWDDRLEQGPSIRPEDLEPKTHERRDARIEQDREMRDRADRAERDSWRDRRHEGDEYREERREERREYRRDDGRHDQNRDEDSRSGRLHLTVEPHDASVYLDGRFLGTADDVARMRSGLLVDPGQHTLSIVRPGRRSEEQRFDVKPGAELDLRIDLKSE